MRLSVAGSRPSSWRVYDEMLDPPAIQQAAETIPPPSWDGWVTYDSPGEQKLAANNGLSSQIRTILGLMNVICPWKWTRDATLHGGGVHMMPPGGYLDLHLDCDSHPKTGYRRAANAILFVDDWQPSWGGELELWSATERLVSITPRFNRLVVFETNDESYHGVPEPIRAPPGVWRRTFCVTFWETIFVANPKRPRALFVPRPGEPPDPVKDAWRKQRSQCRM